VLGASSAHALRAQAPPGPIIPSRTADTATSAPPRLNPRAQPPPPPKPTPRETIAGSWKLNRDQSDDARKKIEEANRGNTNSRNGTWGSGGGGGGNGPYGGGPMGGGYPFPGPAGGGPYGGNPGPGGGQGNDTESAWLREYIYPANSVDVVIKDAETDFVEDSGRKLVFYTDGRKLQKSKDQNYREISAHWEGARLVAKEKSPQGGDIRRTFELSGDGRQLDEYVTVEVGRSNRPLMLHYLYDIIP